MLTDIEKSKGMPTNKADVRGQICKAGKWKTECQRAETAEMKEVEQGNLYKCQH